jgi:hypothetical protein
MQSLKEILSFVNKRSATLLRQKIIDKSVLKNEIRKYHAILLLQLQ